VEIGSMMHTSSELAFKQGTQSRSPRWNCRMSFRSCSRMCWWMLKMRKHDRPETQINLAPFTIGLGPNFTAGETVHAAVETGWNEDLGKVIRDGATRPLEGEPQTIAGHARDRYVYAPAAGMVRTVLQIGVTVTKGQEVARIGEILLRAPISGIIRGLTHDLVPVKERTKVIEVDPRGDEAQITGIAKRPGKIAAGVLKAIEEKYRN